MDEKSAISWRTNSSQSLCGEPTKFRVPFTYRQMRRKTTSTGLKRPIYLDCFSFSKFLFNPIYLNEFVQVDSEGNFVTNQFYLLWTSEGKWWFLFWQTDEEIPTFSSIWNKDSTVLANEPNKQSLVHDNLFCFLI